MRRYASAIIMLVVMCSLAVSGRAMISEKDDIPDLPSVSPEGFEPLRASIINNNPAQFTIDVRKFANIGVDEDAANFKKSGLLGLQVHQGPPMTIDLKNIRIRELK